MSMIHTIQCGYTPMRPSDVTSDDTALDGVTAGVTYHESDRPAEAFELGPEYNAAEIIFPCGQLRWLRDGVDADVDDDDPFVFKLWGYAESGPAEFLCDVSAVVGKAKIDDAAVALYVDTLTIDEQAHTRTISVADAGGGDRVAKLTLDTTGLKWIYFEAYDTSNACNGFIRPF